MSAEYAPQAIFDLFNAVQKLIPSALLGGIMGDAAHVYGYHRARAVLPGDDYSVTETLDQQGDAWACSALDVTLGETPLMHTVSQRLLDARDDPRMAPIREFFGTVDGSTICGWDWSADSPTSSDDMSHLFHVHLSVHRAYANNAAILAPVAEVLAGVPYSGHVPDSGSETPIPSEEDDLPLNAADKAWIIQTVHDQNVAWGRSPEFQAIIQTKAHDSSVSVMRSAEFKQTVAGAVWTAVSSSSKRSYAALVSAIAAKIGA